MDKLSKIGKVVWEARKALRPYDGDNPIKKWSTAYAADKSQIMNAIKTYLETGKEPEIKDWDKEEVGLLCKISEYLDKAII